MAFWNWKTDNKDENKTEDINQAIGSENNADIIDENNSNNNSDNNTDNGDKEEPVKKKKGFWSSLFGLDDSAEEESIENASENADVTDEAASAINENLVDTEKNTGATAENASVIDENPENTAESASMINENPENTAENTSVIDENPENAAENTSAIDENLENTAEATSVIDENLATAAETAQEATENADESESANTDENAEPVTKKGLFARLKEGLAKTRNNIVSGMDSLFNSDEKIDEDFYDELEETLILGDIGVHATEDILDKLRANVKSEHIRKRSDCKEFLIKTLKEIMDQGETAYEFETKPSVVFIIGVNGVGKTTSIGKLAAHLKGMNKRVMMAACDTFRAAAGSQLEEWSHRAGVELIGGDSGQDPSSVLFDAVTAAKARNVDVLLVDTAGRLHNKKNLMEELKKMNRIIDKVCGDTLHRENLIVLDASTGQNALNQAKEFGEAADLTGIILTKMDGTAKGGIAIAIQAELGVPVKYIGVGEKIADLQKFDSNSFVDALFDVDLSDIGGNSDDADSEENNNAEDDSE